VQLGNIRLCMWAPRFMQRFSGKCGESPRHPGHARQRTAVIMMNDGMVIIETIRDGFCRVSRYCKEHVVTKGMVFRPSDSRGTRLQDGTAWLLAWQAQEHGDAYILGVVVHMTKKTCRDVCKYMIHTVVEGLDHRSGESMRLRGSRDSEHKIGTYLFHI